MGGSQEEGVKVAVSVVSTATGTVREAVLDVEPEESTFCSMTSFAGPDRAKYKF